MEQSIYAHHSGTGGGWGLALRVFFPCASASVCKAVGGLNTKNKKNVEKEKEKKFQIILLVDTARKIIKGPLNGT